MKLFNLIFSLVLIAQTSTAATLDELLQKVKEESVVQSAEYKKREAEFVQKKNEQQALLRKAQAELSTL